ncbi:Proline--tRNA ligase [Trichinella spiralis]|uniref:Proline--tRNA ligase n=1 Tax=Trichinella spiralis TaxID=6334 RepID=A0ABR3KP55_TRISP
MDEFEFFELCSDIEETNRIPGVPTKSDLLRAREKREFLAFRNYERQFINMLRNYELRKKTHFPLNASIKCLFMDAYCENDALLSIWNLNDVLVSSELHFNDETIFYENACLCETALDGIKFFVAGRTDSSNNCSLFEAAFSRESTSQLLPLTRKAAILASNSFIFKTMLRFRNFAETMAVNKDGSCVYVGMSGFEFLSERVP